MKYALMPNLDEGGIKKVYPKDKDFDSDLTFDRARYLFMDNGIVKEGFILPVEYNEEIEKEIKKAGYTYSDGIVWTKDHKWVEIDGVIKSDIATDIESNEDELTNSKMGTLKIVDDLLEVNLLFFKAYYEKI